MNELKANQIFELVKCLSVSELEWFKILMEEYNNNNNFKEGVIIDEDKIEKSLLEKQFNVKFNH
jgi:hypothetical protein